MNYVIAILIAIICICLSYITLDQELTNKLLIFNLVSAEKIKGTKKIDHSVRVIVSCVIGVISFGVVLKIFEDVSDWINICKMILSLICLLGAAGVDFREHRIPNIFPLIMVVGGMACLGLGIAFSQEGAISYIVSSVMATIGCAICLTVASILTKQGIGLGDIKLLCSLALVGGVYVFCGTLFFSVIFSSIAAIILLARKKKSMKEAIPFGPFIWAGYIVTVVMTIY